MDTALLGSLMLFTLAGGVTPGPNNIILMSMGISYGFRRCLPYIAGVAVGFAIVLTCAILGLGAVVERFPVLLKVTTVIGALWLVWLAFGYFKAALKPAVKADAPDAPIKKPMGFIDAVAFQWVNPKGLIFAFGAATAYMGIHPSLTMRIIIIVAMFNLAGLIGNAAWALGGTAINRLLSGGRTAIFINVLMGVVILATALFIVHAGFAPEPEDALLLPANL